jgi:hypothetical protein
MITDITMLRLNDAAKNIERIFKQELIEMARYQPLRFYDFNQYLETVRKSPICEEDMTDYQYDILAVASVIQRVLSDIPEKRLKPKVQELD